MFECKHDTNNQMDLRESALIQCHHYLLTTQKVFFFVFIEAWNTVKYKIFDFELTLNFQ